MLEAQKSSRISFKSLQETGDLILDDLELKNDAQIILSNGSKALAWKDDQILDISPTLKQFQGKTYLQLTLRHNTNKFKNPENPQFRTYSGLIAYSDFQKSTPKTVKTPEPKKPEPEPVPEREPIEFLAEAKPEPPQKIDFLHEAISEEEKEKLEKEAEKNIPPNVAKTEE